MKLLTVSPAPHLQKDHSVQKLMFGVVLAMMPAFLFSVYNFGWGAVFVTFNAVAFCIIFEYLINRYLLNRPATVLDGSAIITGMLLAFNLPSNLPWHLLAIGCLVAVGIGKMAFGGLGNNPFNPALVGRVFLLISFPVQMTNWPTTGTAWQVDGMTAATPLGIIKDGLKGGETLQGLQAQLPSYGDLFWGLQGGSLGEMSAFALLLGLAFMLYRGIISWHIPVSVLGSVAAFSALLWAIDPLQFPDPVFQLLTGGVMLGAIFMATDYVTSPMNHRGMLVFGIGIGLITVLIRAFGAYPEGISFAILIMNAFVPLLNKYLKPHRFGR